MAGFGQCVRIVRTDRVRASLGSRCARIHSLHPSSSRPAGMRPALNGFASCTAVGSSSRCDQQECITPALSSRSSSSASRLETAFHESVCALSTMTLATHETKQHTWTLAKSVSHHRAAHGLTPLVCGGEVVARHNVEGGSTAQRGEGGGHERDVNEVHTTMCRHIPSQLAV